MYFKRFITTVAISSGILYVQSIANSNIENTLAITSKFSNHKIETIGSQDSKKGNKKVSPLSLRDVAIYALNLKEQEAKLVSLKFDLVVIAYLISIYKDTKKIQETTSFKGDSYEFIKDICSTLNQSLKDKKLIKQGDNETVFLHYFNGKPIKFVLNKNFRDPKNKALIRKVQ